MFGAVVLVGQESVVARAQESQIRDRRLSAFCERAKMVKLELVGRAAAIAARPDKRAARVIAAPDLGPHRGRHMATDR